MSENVNKENVTNETEESSAVENLTDDVSSSNELNAVNKNDVLAEKIARRTEVKNDIKELRDIGNYDGAEFLLNELKSLNKTIKLFSK
jgi:hypothetical protein